MPANTIKYYIIAGEASGDLHGSHLIKNLFELNPGMEVRCWGGDKMQQAGATLVKHYRSLAFMGFIEVVKNLKTILQNLDFCKKDIAAFQPDVLVLIDYPGFNLRIAKWAKTQGFKVIYYISPQVWAWKENRVKMMKQCIDQLLVILPFEKEYFQEAWKWDVTYVGHPLVEIIESFKKTYLPQALSTKPIVALLPGSRKQEIEKKLPIMLEVSRLFPDYQFIVAKASSISHSFYQPFTQPYPNVSMVENKTYELLAQAKAALVTSGTATLETALFAVPQIVCYKGANISYQIARRVIKVKYIALANLILDRMLVKELIQNELTKENIQAHLTTILTNTQKADALRQGYATLKQMLTAGGNASENAAKIINGFATKIKHEGSLSRTN